MLLNYWIQGSQVIAKVWSEIRGGATQRGGVTQIWPTVHNWPAQIEMITSGKSDEGQISLYFWYIFLNI